MKIKKEMRKGSKHKQRKRRQTKNLNKVEMEEKQRNIKRRLQFIKKIQKKEQR